jgi:hypothetical protein
MLLNYLLREEARGLDVIETMGNKIVERGSNIIYKNWYIIILESIAEILADFMINSEFI